ncbi:MULTISPECIES: sulfurtransferase complex subunit TusB [Vibrio]|uniref:sulfurtransferase complex subunit TusB n=1 Tax=Vibrio TaxID=662 RepID=UPI0014090A33|nr:MULTISPECIES: sulfurtransferase complex subunit TusB [unclassified Vibrio]QIL85262.1 sulfurtransferase complex subunit TusB [Vibrio sp. HDW18]
MLHIIKHLEKIPLVSAYLLPGDVVILTENAVYAAALQSPYRAYLMPEIQYSALREDLAARGWQTKVDAHVEVITMSDWVDLTASHEKSITW